MDADQVLTFRLARSGLAVRGARDLAEAAACPASDFARDAALLALATRAEGVSREAFRHPVDAGELVVAHVVRGAIHALSPAQAGARLDSERRYRWGEPGATPPASDAVRRFLGFYRPATAGEFAAWAGLAKSHAQRLWGEAAGDLAEVRVGTSTGWLMSGVRRRPRGPRRRDPAGLGGGHDETRRSSNTQRVSERFTRSERTLPCVDQHQPVRIRAEPIARADGRRGLSHHPPPVSWRRGYEVQGSPPRAEVLGLDEDPPVRLARDLAER